MLKKINNIFELKGIFVFSHLQLTALEPELTEVAWRTRKSWSSGAEDR